MRHSVKPCTCLSAHPRSKLPFRIHLVARTFPSQQRPLDYLLVVLQERAESRLHPWHQLRLAERAALSFHEAKSSLAMKLTSKSRRRAPAWLRSVYTASKAKVGAVLLDILAVELRAGS